MKGVVFMDDQKLKLGNSKVLFKNMISHSFDLYQAEEAFKLFATDKRNEAHFYLDMDKILAKSWLRQHILSK